MGNAFPNNQKRDTYYFTINKVIMVTDSNYQQLVINRNALIEKGEDEISEIKIETQNLRLSV